MGGLGTAASGYTEKSGFTGPKYREDDYCPGLHVPASETRDRPRR